MGLSAWASAAPLAGEADLSPSNGFAGKLKDGNICRLAAIGRPGANGFMFWTVAGRRIAAPSGYARAKSGLAGIDTVLVIEESRVVSRNFLTELENALMPVDAFGTVITMCQGAGTTFGVSDSGVPGDRSLVAHHYVVPFSVIRDDGTASFQFQATTSLNETLEELVPNSGWSRVLNARFEVLVKMVRKETQMEVRTRELTSGLGFVARIREDSGKLREMKPTGRSGSSTFFTLTKGQIEKLLVVRPVISRLTISGVPMAPEDINALPTRVNRVNPLHTPRNPEPGEPASAMNGWRGRTLGGATYSLVGMADQAGAWNQVGIPIWRPGWVPSVPKTSVQIGSDLGGLGPIQVVNPLSNEVMPLELKPVAKTTTRNWSEVSFDLIGDSPDFPVTLRFRVPSARGAEIAEIREVRLRRMVSNRPL